MGLEYKYSSTALKIPKSTVIIILDGNWTTRVFSELTKLSYPGEKGLGKGRDQEPRAVITLTGLMGESFRMLIFCTLGTFPLKELWDNWTKWGTDVCLHLPQGTFTG